MSNNRNCLSADVEQYKLFFKKEQRRLTGLANKEFGLNSWSHSVTKQDIDCVDYIDGCYSVAASAVVKIVLKQGIYHEELGCGLSFGLSSKAISIANARQEAKLDALNKALCSFNSDLEVEENVELEKDSSVCDTDTLWKSKTSFHPRQTSKSQIMASPQNVSARVATATTSPTLPAAASSSVSEQQEQRDLRAARKRKQQQLQEEYRSRMKLKEKQQLPTNKENTNDQFLANAAVDNEPAFLSTQEVDEMMKTAAVHLKPECPAYRVPLISSPVSNSNRGWTSNNNCIRTPNNSRSNRLFVN